MNEIKKSYGIDLGTTYSCISYVDEFSKPVILPNSENSRVTPSVVFFDGDEIIVGEVAKENSKVYPEDVVSYIKRSMGDEFFIFNHQDKEYKPEEISALILKKLVKDANEYLGEDINDVVITCPAYFGINEREATKNAGIIAGLNVKQIINEPTAAAISYGMEKSQDKVVIVYDLGGGTFDITMIDIKDEEIKVIGTGGDHNLGGKDWDDAIIRFVAEEFKKETSINDDILEDPDTAQDLSLQAERAKKTLSTRDKAPIVVTYGGQRCKVILTKEKFDEITKDLLDRTITLTKEMMQEAKKKNYEKFDEFLLVGGSSRMPQIMKTVSKEFPQLEPKLFDPDESVSKGAAIFAWKLALGEEICEKIANKTGTKKEEVKIDEVSNELIQEASQDVADTFGLTLGSVKKSLVKIKNVSSKSFGIVAFKNDKEILFNLILKNDEVPKKVVQRFGTKEANQESVEIKIMENESSDKMLDPEICSEIGVAELNLPQGLKYDSPIEVSFELNEEGRLTISATELTDNRNIIVNIETSSIMTQEEIEEAKEKSKGLIVS